MKIHKPAAHQKALKKTTKPSVRKNARRTKALKSLNDLVGLGKGIWKEDAQEYINRLRE